MGEEILVSVSKKDKKKNIDLQKGPYEAVEDHEILEENDKQDQD